MVYICTCVCGSPSFVCAHTVKYVRTQWLYHATDTDLHVQCKMYCTHRIVGHQQHIDTDSPLGKHAWQIEPVFINICAFEIHGMTFFCTIIWQFDYKFGID